MPLFSTLLHAANDCKAQIVAVDPSPVVEGKFILNSTTHELKIGYGGIWITLHTLTAPVDYFYLTEDGFYYLQENGIDKYIME